MSAHHCEIAALLFGRIFLLVCILVFLVYYYEAGFWQRSEDGGSCADDHFCFSFSDAMPLIEALPLREMRVQHGDLVLQGGEARFEMLNSLGGESDFGNED